MKKCSQFFQCKVVVMMFHIVQDQGEVFICLKVIVKGGFTVVTEHKGKEDVHPVNTAGIGIIICFPKFQRQIFDDSADAFFLPGEEQQIVGLGIRIKIAAEKQGDQVILRKQIHKGRLEGAFSDNDIYHHRGLISNGDIVRRIRRDQAEFPFLHGVEFFFEKELAGSLKNVIDFKKIMGVKSAVIQIAKLPHTMDIPLGRNHEIFSEVGGERGTEIRKYQILLIP